MFVLFLDGVVGQMDELVLDFGGIESILAGGHTDVALFEEIAFEVVGDEDP